uniref:Uncharacterized protein n=1 Tax=Cannabis sativa TaxID=3483 RepID=A0A803NFE2_CANSA
MVALGRAKLTSGESSSCPWSWRLGLPHGRASSSSQLFNLGSQVLEMKRKLRIMKKHKLCHGPEYSRGYHRGGSPWEGLRVEVTRLIDNVIMAVPMRFGDMSGVGKDPPGDPLPGEAELREAVAPVGGRAESQ